MKQSRILLLVIFQVFFSIDFINAKTEIDSLKYYDASQFPLLGKVFESSSPRYSRLPDSLESKVRPALWNLGQNSAGLAIRFISNSTRIVAKWESQFNNGMNHMTATGIKGLDLYCFEDGQWHFMNSGRPTGKQNKATIIANMEPEEREYILYLSLYDGVSSLAIGVDSLSDISLPKQDIPKREQPIVFYGTSIMQGGCASRPGMASTNILSRLFNRETINLGFSGNAFLDLELAEFMALVDAGAYVLDFVPNASVEQMKERAIPFYRIIRKYHPDVPIIFVEDPIFIHTKYDKKIAEEVRRKNETINEIFNILKNNGEKHIYFISSQTMLGSDGEATVDGIHFTDVGFMRYVDLISPVLQQVLK